MAGEAVLCRDADDGLAVFFLFSTVVLIAVILCCCFFASLAIFSFFFSFCAAPLVCTAHLFRENTTAIATLATQNCYKDKQIPL